jgi:hypothetical protein
MSTTRKSGLNLNIGTLNLTMQNAQGHEHRITPIAERAASIFATRLQKSAAMNGLGARSLTPIDSLLAAPVNLNLRTMSNEQAASTIAAAWLDSVAQRLKFSK